MEKKSAIRFGTLVLGVLTALAVVLSQLFFFHVPAEHKVKKEHQEAATDSSGDDAAYYTLPSSTLPSSAHVEVNQETFCLFEILFEEEDVETEASTVTLPVSHYLQTLLGAIISPNAP